MSLLRLLLSAAVSLAFVVLPGQAAAQDAPIAATANGPDPAALRTIEAQVSALRGLPAQTPVDLQSYASWKESTDRVAVAGAGGGARVSFSRRSLLDVPAPAMKAMPDGSEPPGAEFEPVSPLDGPAFLRRQSEG